MSELVQNRRIKEVFSSVTSLSPSEKIELLSLLKQDISHEAIPYGVFGTDKLSSLEAIVKYLKEVALLSHTQIAHLIDRSPKTIWATYNNASKKHPEPFSNLRDDLFFPASRLADKQFSVLEHVVTVAKQASYSNHHIGLLLRLDDRTIWTVLNNCKVKHGR